MRLSRLLLPILAAVAVATAVPAQAASCVGAAIDTGTITIVGGSLEEASSGVVLVTNLDPEQFPLQPHTYTIKDFEGDVVGAVEVPNGLTLPAFVSSGTAPFTIYREDGVSAEFEQLS